MFSVPEGSLFCESKKELKNSELVDLDYELVIFKN